MTERPLVLVCGLPGSGNRFLQTYIRQLGFEAAIYHGNDQTKPDFIKASMAAKFMVIPVRHPIFQRTSGGRSKSIKGGARTSLWTKEAFWQAATNNLSVHLISYEAMVDDPPGVLGYLCRWLGVEYQQPAVVVVDGNAKHKKRA